MFMNEPTEPLPDSQAMSEYAEFDPLPDPPLMPDDSSCCGSGCATCVWDIYREEWDLYQQQLAQWRARHTSAAKPADERTEPGSVA